MIRPAVIRPAVIRPAVIRPAVIRPAVGSVWGSGGADQKATAIAGSSS